MSPRYYYKVLYKDTHLVLWSSSYGYSDDSVGRMLGIVYRLDTTIYPPLEPRLTKDHGLCIFRTVSAARGFRDTFRRRYRNKTFIIYKVAVGRKGWDPECADVPFYEMQRIRGASQAKLYCITSIHHWYPETKMVKSLRLIKYIP